MTEDDTFDRLRRVPYYEIMRLLCELPVREKVIILLHRDLRYEFVTRYGWTLKDFDKIYRQYND